MNESFNFKRFASLFVWSAYKNKILYRVAINIFVFIQLGWLKSKSNLDSTEFMNIYISTLLLVCNYLIYQNIIKRGVAQFLLLPATTSEKFMYAFVKVFVAALFFSILTFALAEVSSRMLFSVSHEWFAFDVDFTIWIVFLTTILFYVQLLILPKSNSMALLIVLYIAISSVSILIDNYFIIHYAQYTPIRLWLYTLLSVGFVGASYLQFVKCEATFQTKTPVLK